ncbi:MAG: DUF433 domain-containing protein [Gammaproteobacteria bacterium]|nr:DUF433 domain-containing protein [Gammaproteobacteria bacterium]
MTNMKHEHEFLERITASVDIFGGKPVIRGMRIPGERVPGKRSMDS